MALSHELPLRLVQKIQTILAGSGAAGGRASAPPPETRSLRRWSLPTAS